jgi:hypothetical protein
MRSKKHMALAAAIVFWGGSFNSASAELLVNPAAKTSVGKTQVAGLFGTSSVTYSDDFNDKGDIDRNFLGVSAAYGMSDGVDVFGALALITKAEVEDFPDDDSGTAFALGVRGILPMQADLKLHGYAQYLSIDEDYGSFVDGFGDTISLSGKETSLSAGVVATKKVENITVYGGAEFIFMSDGKVTVTDSSLGTAKGDIERDDTLGFRAGAYFNAGEFDMSVGFAFAHETGFALGLSKEF